MKGGKGIGEKRIKIYFVWLQIPYNVYGHYIYLACTKKLVLKMNKYPLKYPKNAKH